MLCLVARNQDNVELLVHDLQTQSVSIDPSGGSVLRGVECLDGFQVSTSA